MAIVVWDSNYSVGIQEIDEQHKCIVELMNDLYEAMIHKKNRDMVAGILVRLVEYTKIHFAVEETLMRIFGYREYEEHKLSHDILVARVLDYRNQFIDGNDKIGIELLMLLRDWLFDHIQHADQKYSKALREAGVKNKWLKNFGSIFDGFKKGSLSQT